MSANLNATHLHTFRQVYFYFLALFIKKEQQKEREEEKRRKMKEKEGKKEKKGKNFALLPGRLIPCLGFYFVHTINYFAISKSF